MVDTYTCMYPICIYTHTHTRVSDYIHNIDLGKDFRVLSQKNLTPSYSMACKFIFKTEEWITTFDIDI